MKVKSSKNGSACTLTVEGKIDTMTAPELDEAVKSNLPKCDKMNEKVVILSNGGLYLE